ncbi:MAG: elongation factor P [Megasphaera sp.]|jgi:elongation factor P|uniref:elongation factor P n=1 Tax=Megasphaera sueciensis TaxID=349094 RepID=UPI003D00097D|nr:elongation factor P [Megasphaera sp.]MCI1823163.1 elongation factor P [Megasphaera sp.]
MISSNDLRPGVTIEIDGKVWQVVEFQHVKPGKGAAFVRAKIKNLETGAVVERTWNAGEKVQEGHVDRRQMQYLYESEGAYCFMDNETYEQLELQKETLGTAINFLKEEMNVTMMLFQNRVIGIDLPAAVELKVVETDPGVRGDTATGGSKPATLETGYVVKVPLFINEGELLQIDTRTGEYMGRA